MPDLSGVQKLFELAQEHDGYFTSAEATGAGVSRVALAGYVERGTLMRESRGVYRLKRYPEISQNSYLWQSVLWPQLPNQGLAILSHVTALRMHELSDVNPENIHITVPAKSRGRRTTPPHLVVHRADLEPYEITYADGLPVTTVERTLRDIAATPDRTLLTEALRDARKRNLEIPRELRDA